MRRWAGMTERDWHRELINALDAYTQNLMLILQSIRQRYSDRPTDKPHPDLEPGLLPEPLWCFNCCGLDVREKYVWVFCVN